jgi:tRNA threonylcarbamoyladenosine biosynthesis protein TsaB
MTILGIDTAIPTASVALVDDRGLLAEEIHGGLVSDGNGGTAKPLGNHSEAILPLIDKLLERARLTIQHLSGIAVSIGPGSFTGLRIGLATAKGIAYESGLPLVGISTLHANAARVNNYNGVIGSLLDARKGEVYLALFRRDAMNTIRLSSDSVLSIESAIELLRERCDNTGAIPLLVGNGAMAHERRLRERLGESLVLVANGCYPSVASQVALLGRERIADATLDDVGTLTPIYLRLSEAESKRRNLS